MAPASGLPPHMKYVLAGGAAGGFVSWVYSETVGTKMALPMLGAIAACFVLGAAAALISVYVVANSDVNNTPRLLAFAVICGLFWKPVLDSSVSYVNQKRDAAASNQKSAEALQTLDSATATAQPAAVAAATEATTDLLRTSDRLNDPELQKTAAARTEELISAISEKGGSNPTAAVAALTEVRVAAEATGNPHLAGLANVEIRKLEPRTRVAPRIERALPTTTR